MSDAWEILAAHSTSGDAWERLNGITGGSCVAGQPITELSFTLSGVSQITGTVSAHTIEGIIGTTEIEGTIEPISITSEISVAQISGVIEVEEI